MKRLRLPQQILQNRQRERAGLPRTGLRETDDVFTSQRVRDGLDLNRGGGGPLHLFTRGAQFFADAERGERDWFIFRFFIILFRRAFVLRRRRWSLSLVVVASVALRVRHLFFDVSCGRQKNEAQVQLFEKMDHDESEK